LNLLISFGKKFAIRSHTERYFHKIRENLSVREGSKSTKKSVFIENAAKEKKLKIAGITQKMRL
jgi:hypothetical protein